MTRSFKKILVTGASAVTGHAMRAIAHEYDASFIFIGSRECDLRDWNSTRDFFEHQRPDGVINLAAVSGGIGLSIKHPASMLRDNVLININVLEASRLIKVDKVVLALTTGMYPPAAPVPYSEDFDSRRSTSRIQLRIILCQAAARAGGSRLSRGIWPSCCGPNSEWDFW